VIISRLHHGSLDHVIATRPSCLRIFLACTGHPTRLVIEGAGLTKSIVGDRLHCCKAALGCVSQPSASGKASAYSRKGHAARVACRGGGEDHAEDFKTRELAARACEFGRIQSNG
jgi:hypothetical protein